ncbi:MAG: CerR family C-terminal domain-containing protein [Planctomycetaceae bacterium]
MSDDTRTRVLHAAGPIFAEKGCDGATVREICAAAEANLASVNYHFRDKETLYLETVTLAHTLRLQQVPPPATPDDAPPEDKLRRFIEAMLSRMLGTRELGWQTRLMMREMLHPTAACKPLVEEFIRPQLNQLLAILDELLPEQTPQHRRIQTAFSIVGQCLHYRVAREFVDILVPAAERDAHYSSPQLAEHITQFTLAALRLP